MALTEPTSGLRTVLWANIVGEVAVKASSTINPGDPVGYNSGWVQADANGPYEALFFAVKGGEGGDTIPVADSIGLRGFTLGTVDGPLFLSDTAGGFSETPSTTSSQCIGRVLAADRIVLRAPDLKYMPAGVNFGYGQKSAGATAAILHGTGTNAAPYIHTATTPTFLDYYTRCSYAGGYALGLHVQLSVSGAGGDGLCASFVGRVDNTSGSAVGVGGVDGWGVWDDAAPVATGMIYGVGAAAIADARTAALTPGFVLTSLFLASSFGANVGQGARMSFIYCQDWGSVKMPYFLDITDLTSGASNAFYTGDQNHDTDSGVLRVATPSGTMYLKLFT